jgi:hypothetical protein
MFHRPDCRWPHRQYPRIGPYGVAASAAPGPTDVLPQPSALVMLAAMASHPTLITGLARGLGVEVIADIRD